jgi:translocon-associated protein subunit alpha
MIQTSNRYCSCGDHIFWFYYVDFAAGQVVKSLIGFTNKGQNDFIVSAIEASFRYPEDFSYFIQNFSKIYYETYVPPGAEVSFVYDFTPSETLYSRPFGMVVSIYYKNEVSKVKSSCFLSLLVRHS